MIDSSNEETLEEKCIHHWLIPENEKAVRLPKAMKAAHPNCFGRKATCKKCNLESILVERIWDNNI